MGKKYDNEFKVMIVELLQSGIKATQVNEEYGLNISMIGRWRREYATKQAAALMSIANLVDAKKTNTEVLKRDGVERMSTFYGYSILEAMAKAGDYDGALKVIRDYWGGMLDLGATTFWEDFDVLDVTNNGRIDEIVPPGKFDIHGDFGEYCYVGYRHSLCYGWASGPVV